MKKLLITCLITLAAGSGFAQGTVNFANASTTSGLPPGDRNVKFDASSSVYNPALVAGANVSSNYAGVNLSSLRAALYWAPLGNTQISTFQQAIGGVSTFKQSTSPTAGSWFSKTATLGTSGASPGTTVNLAVVIWDSSLDAANPFSPAALNGLNNCGGHIFQYTVPSSATPAPSEFLMLNYGGDTFFLCPEPSAAGILGLGGLILLFRRRRTACG